MIHRLVAVIERDPCGTPHITELRPWGWLDRLVGAISGRGRKPIPADVSNARVVDYAIEIPSRLFGILLSDKEPGNAEARHIRLVLIPPPTLPEQAPQCVESL